MACRRAPATYPFLLPLKEGLPLQETTDKAFDHESDTYANLDHEKTSKVLKTFEVSTLALHGKVGNLFNSRSLSNTQTIQIIQKGKDSRKYQICGQRLYT